MQSKNIYFSPIIFFIIISSCKSSNINILEGDWYYFTNDKAYHEVYFKDSFYIDCSELFGFTPKRKYVFLKDTIYSYIDSVQIMKNRVILKNNTLNIIFDVDTLKLKKMKSQIIGRDAFSIQNRDQYDVYIQEFNKRRDECFLKEQQTLH